MSPERRATIEAHAKRSGSYFLQDTLAALAEAEARIEKLERNAEYACQEPRDDCQCVGCLTAQDAAARGEL